MEKVTAFVTRGDAWARELLVFDHAGTVQVPSGTVEVDEDPRDAVRREVREECGLERVRLVRRVAILSERLSPPMRMALSTTELRDGPSGESGGLGVSVRRGLNVDVVSEVGGSVEVSGDGVASDAADPDRAVLLPVRGWIGADQLSGEFVRHCFHVVPKDDTRDAWSVPSDHGFTFHLRWVPLHPKPKLSAFQQFWLDRSYELLV